MCIRDRIHVSPSVAGLSQRDPLLCEPALRRVCLYRESGRLPKESAFRLRSFTAAREVSGRGAIGVSPRRAARRMYAAEPPVDCGRFLAAQQAAELVDRVALDHELTALAPERGGAAALGRQGRELVIERYSIDELSRLLRCSKTTAIDGRL